MNTRSEVLVPISDIRVAKQGRERPVYPETIPGLAANISERGLRVPIEVAKAKRGYRLVSGGHRLAACTKLGWETIPAFVVEGSELELQRDELLENLMRNELLKIDRAVFVARFKQVHLELHPEAAHGGDRRSEDFRDVKITAWFDALAGVSGWGVETIKKAAKIGEKLSAETIDAIRNTKLADNQSELEALSKYSPPIQKTLVEKLTGEKPATSVLAAVRLTEDRPDTSEEDPDETQFKKIVDLWERLPKKTQDRFLSHIGVQISAEDAD